jgi:arginine decarboxylase
VLTGREAQVVQDLADAAKKISVKNYREFYHDAVEYRDQMYSLFNLGMLGLEERGKGEVFFRDVAMKAVRFSKSAKFVADEFQELETKLHDKYICNFSVFQSVPDHWALDQLFPIIPVHRLNELPTRKATLADITCDSDGEVEKFVDLKDIKDALEVHEIKDGEAYYLAFALVGAYQDTMGDMHNLFGRVNEAEVILGPKGTPFVSDVRRGEPAGETLACFGYDGTDLTDAVKAQLREKQNRGEITDDEAAAFLDIYTAGLSQYTYLD